MSVNSNNVKGKTIKEELRELSQIIDGVVLRSKVAIEQLDHTLKVCGHVKTRLKNIYEKEVVADDERQDT